MSTGETVALKMLSHRLLYQSGALLRFRREAVTLESLRHDDPTDGSGNSPTG